MTLGTFAEDHATLRRRKKERQLSKVSRLQGHCSSSNGSVFLLAMIHILCVFHATTRLDLSFLGFIRRVLVLGGKKEIFSKLGK